MKTRAVLTALLFAANTAIAHAEDMVYSVGDNLRIEVGNCADTRGKPIMGNIKYRELIGYNRTKIGECQNGKIEGIEKWYKGEQLEGETPYKNGKAEGIGKTYYESGKIRAETPFKNDKAEGIQKVYYENGKLKSETPYKNAAINGEEKVYRANSKLLFTKIYKKDRPISGVCYQSNGKTANIPKYELENLNIYDLENDLKTDCP